MPIFDDLKSVANTLREADKIPQYQQILDALEKLIEMQNKIFILETENKDLKESLKIQKSLTFENNAYWINLDGKKDGPYCSCCWDDNKKTIRMQSYGNPAYYSCPKCDNKNVEIYPEKKIRYDVVEPESYT
jgi:Zn finger protein HypA/HybF involved in hydrogenase expression